MLRAIPFLAGCVLLIGFASPSAAHADRAAENQHLADVRAIQTGNGATTWAAIERKALIAAAGRARRNGANLTLKLENGRQITLRNHEKECFTLDHVDRCRVFHLEAHLPTRHLFVAHVGYYEGGDYLLIDDQTGSQTVVSAEPQFGPDADLVLVIDDDEAYGSGKELQIWRRSGGRFVSEWVWEPTDESHHIDVVRWVTASKIILNFHTLEWLGHPARHWPATLEKHVDGWRLDMNAAR